MFAKLLGSRVVGGGLVTRMTRAVRWQSVQTATVDSTPDSNSKLDIRPQSSTVKLRRNYRAYDNYAPLLFEWSQQVVNNDTTVEQLVQTDKFKKVSDAICDTTRHSEKNLLNLTKSLIVMRMNPNERIVRFLENELMFKLDNYDFKLLVQAFILFNNVSETSERRKEIVEQIKIKINEKLDSTEPSILCLLQLVKISQHLSADTLIKIEEQLTKILDQQEDIPLDVLCYLLVLLSRYNRRNKPLIRTTVNKLLKYRSEEIYSIPPHLIHMICSLNRLNYPEVNLLEKCADILINAKFLDITNDSSKRDFLVAISQLNFSYPKLFDYYLQNVIENPELFKHQDLVTITITFARLHYQNKEIVDVIRSQVMPRCSDSQQFLTKTQWFNYVNALTLLGCATEEQLKEVHNVNFLREMEHEEIENHLLKIQQREEKWLSKLQLSPVENIEESTANEPTEESLSIQNIYHIMNLRRKYLTFCGLVLSQKYRGESQLDFDKIFASPAELEEFESFINNLEFTPFKKSKDLEQFRQAVFKAMDTFAPNEKYMKTNVVTPFGFVIDAILVVDAEGNPVPLKDEDKVDKLSITACKELAASNDSGNHRVALMSIGFNDTLLDSSSTLIGPKETEVKILRSLGFKVVCIHQNSLPNYSTASNLNRIKFLQDLIVSNLKV